MTTIRGPPPPLALLSHSLARAHTNAQRLTPICTRACARAHTHTHTHTHTHVRACALKTRYGCYEAVDGGSGDESLRALTGQPVETVQLEKQPGSKAPVDRETGAVVSHSPPPFSESHTCHLYIHFRLFATALSSSSSYSTPQHWPLLLPRPALATTDLKPWPLALATTGPCYDRSHTHHLQLFPQLLLCFFLTSTHLTLLVHLCSRYGRLLRLLFVCLQLGPVFCLSARPGSLWQHRVGS